MKIKRWLIISYILVILSPIVTGTILFTWISNYDKDIKLENYLENTSRFSKYEEKLKDPKIYLDYSGDYDFLSEDDKNYAEIRLYNKYGYSIYSSGSKSMNYIVNKENLYKNFYDIKVGYKADSIRKPVFLDNQIIGIYEITLNKNDFVKEVNKRTLLAVGLFALNFIIVLFVAIKMIDKKINNPLKLLIHSMKRFAKGENIEIDYSSKDEIGELILKFDSMKDQIEENNYKLEIEKNSKEYMISAISHDLKTPLTSIRAYTEIIKDEAGNEHTKKYEDIILQKCDYMKDMLEDLHLYTLLTSDYKGDFAEVEGEELFQMITSGYSEIFSQNKLDYQEEINIKGNYLVDVKSMIRLMDNLITNALKYSEDRGRVFLGIYSKEFPLSTILDSKTSKLIEDFKKEESCIIVQNTGKTISQEELKDILEPFYKADNSRSNKKSGTGLGLSIVKKIIEKHKGRLKIISENNTTTVICTIKREDD